MAQENNRIYDTVYGFKSKHKEGFTPDEIKELLKKYPDINMDKYHDALYGSTCIMKDGEVITYKHDVVVAIRCGIENRNLKWYEWD